MTSTYCDDCGRHVSYVELEDSDSVEIFTTRTNDITLVNDGNVVVLKVLNEYSGEHEPLANIHGNTVTIYNDKHLTEENNRLQNLVNDFEAANIRRQGEIEKLRSDVLDLIKNHEVQLNIKKGQLKAKEDELKQLRKTRNDKIVDYSLVDPDLLRKYAVMSLTGDYNTYDHGSELEELQERIEEDATFHPHVQQQIVTDDQGRKRFRKNVLVDRLVEECGINYAFGITASREDRAQLAQLIGYSVDGYQSLDYALPVEGEEE